MQKILLQTITIAVIAITLTISACHKEDQDLKDTGDIKIVRLIATDTILKAFIDTSLVIVEATGNNLNYEWTCNHGALRGSGDTVKYAAGQCCIGLNTITCRVYNDSSSVSKDINILVTSYFENK